MIIPIGHEDQTVRRLPWVTIAVIAINLVCFLTVGSAARRSEEVARERLERVFTFWQSHPYLNMPKELLSVTLPEGEQKRFEIMSEAFKGAGGEIPVDEREQAQRQLNAMVSEYLSTLGENPLRSWGLVPAEFSFSTLISSMFMHAGWLHLLSNLFILYLAGPSIEDVWGRPLFAAFYLVSGIVAALAHVASFPESHAPLIGASGAIAGVMGAFLVRKWRTKIRFFYWWFLRGGVFDAPAWAMLPLWLLQQAFMGSLTKSEDGVAYWAHVGGFVFGVVVAVVVQALRVEERFIHPKIEAKLTLEQHPDLQAGLEFVARGEIERGREALTRAITAEPHNPDAHLAMWQSYAQVGEARQGIGSMVRVIESELKRGELELALTHWRELLATAGSGGPPAMRWRLASQLQDAEHEGWQDVLQHLATDPTADLLGEKARRRLGLPEAPPSPPTPRPLPEVAPTAAGEPVWTQPPAPQVSSFPVADTPVAPPVSLERRQLVVESAVIERLGDDGITVRGEDETTDLLLYGLIDAVSVVGIAEGGKPFLVIDLIVGLSRDRCHVFRALSTQMDPRHILQWFDAPVLEAFRKLVRRIVEASGATVLPTDDAIEKIRMYPSLEAYMEGVLEPLRDPHHR